MSKWNQDLFVKAWNFAAEFHGDQKVPGSGYPYINHLGLVVIEATAAVASSEPLKFPDLLVQCAILHDTLEDTEATREDVERNFGGDVVAGVLALTKDETLPSKEDQMRDSINRIIDQPREVWMVKLCDRITNLQPPPSYWNLDKINNYRSEAEYILDQLGQSSTFLADRLAQKIAHYS